MKKLASRYASLLWLLAALSLVGWLIVNLDTAGWIIISLVVGLMAWQLTRRERRERASRAEAEGPSGSGAASGSAAIGVDGGTDVVGGAAKGGRGQGRSRLPLEEIAQARSGHGRTLDMRIRADRVVVAGDRRASGCGNGGETDGMGLGARREVAAQGR